MSGSDTSRGMNFQYACSIELILEFITNPHWDMIQMEGSTDVEDILIFNNAGDVLVRAQIKQKNDPYQWQPAEFAAVIEAFSHCKDAEETSYQFIYSGSDGLTFSRDIKPVLAKIRAEGTEVLTVEEVNKLTKHFSAEIITFLFKIGRRLELIKHDTRGSLKDRNLMRIRRICAEQLSMRSDINFEEQLYDQLFYMVANATEQVEHYARRLTRAEIIGILGIDNFKHKQNYELSSSSISPLLTLPKLPENFVGRSDILNSLKQAITIGNKSQWIAVYGLPGAGKTAVIRTLVNEVQVQELYPDGVLWGALGRDSDPLTLLGTWATELGINQEELQTLLTIEARARAIRRAIGMRRMLLVIDDVWGLKDALAVGVGGPNCMHIATTRLPVIARDLAATDAFKLDDLSEDQCLELLTKLIPQLKFEQDSQLRELAQLVGYLPLAITLIGKHLRRQGNHPRRLSAAIGKLRDMGERLRINQPQSPIDRHPSISSDVPVSLLAVIQVSVDALDEPTRLALYSLSVLPPKPSSFTESFALAIMGTAADALDILYDSGLIEVISLERYGLHQTIRDFGYFHLVGSDAQHRMVKFILEYVENNHAHFDNLDPEVNNIFAALQYAKDIGIDELYAHFVNACYRYLETRGFYHLIVSHLEHAFLAAQRVNNEHEQSFALYHLGRTSLRLGSPKEAAQYFYKSLEIGAESEDASTLINTMGNLVATLVELNDIQTAERLVTGALSFARKINDQESIVSTLNTFAAVALRQGDENAAEKYLQEAMQQAASLPSYRGLTSILVNMATIIARHGRYQEAEAYLQTALAKAESAQHYEYIVLSLIGIIGLYLRQNKPEEAETYIQRVLPVLETAPLEIGTKQLADYLYTMARVRRGSEQAINYLNVALTFAEREGNSRLLISIESELGANAMLNNQFDSAYKAFENALFLSIRDNFQDLPTGLLLNLGTAAMEQQSYENAERCFAMCLASARSQRNHYESTALLFMGRLALARDQFDQAQLLFKQSADHALCNKDIEGALKALSELGNAALYREEYDIARLYWQKALTLARPQGDPSLIGAALIMLATVELRADQINIAEKTFREAISYAVENDLFDLETVGLYNLIRMYLACDKVEEAHLLGERCFKLLDEMDNDDTANNFRQNLTALLNQEQALKDTDELAKNRHGWVNFQ